MIQLPVPRSHSEILSEGWETTCILSEMILMDWTLSMLLKFSDISDRNEIFKFLEKTQQSSTDPKKKLMLRD